MLKWPGQCAHRNAREIKVGQESRRHLKSKSNIKLARRSSSVGESLDCSARFHNARQLSTPQRSTPKRSLYGQRHLIGSSQVHSQICSQSRHTHRSGPKSIGEHRRMNMSIEYPSIAGHRPLESTLERAMIHTAHTHEFFGIRHWHTHTQNRAGRCVFASR